jgi:hypothetical protein
MKTLAKNHERKLIEVARSNGRLTDQSTFDVDDLIALERRGLIAIEPIGRQAWDVRLVGQGVEVAAKLTK